MDKFDLFQNLMVMAAADRKFTQEEVALLAVRASRWGLTDAEFEKALDHAISDPRPLSVPEGHSQRVQMLQHLLRVMAADGELAPAEKRLFAEAAARIGISGEELDRLIDGLVSSDPGLTGDPDGG